MHFQLFTPFSISMLIRHPISFSRTQWRKINFTGSIKVKRTTEMSLLKIKCLLTVLLQYTHTHTHYTIHALHTTLYIYIYAFSRHFYPKRLTVHSGYTFVSMCVPWELNPWPFALLTQCSTAEPQEQEQYVPSHIAAAPGEQLGVRCLAQKSHLIHCIEGGSFTPKSKWLDNWNCLSFGRIKKGVNFYHCRVVLSTNC